MLHHLRSRRAGGGGVAVRTAAGQHVRLGVGRHGGGVGLLLLWLVHGHAGPVALRGRVLDHHLRPAAHLRHVRAAGGEGGRLLVGRAHLVHLIGWVSMGIGGLALAAVLAACWWWLTVLRWLAGHHHHCGSGGRHLHLSVGHAGAHAVGLHVLPSHLRHLGHGNLSHRSAVAGHLCWCVAWAVLHASGTCELHSWVEALHGPVVLTVRRLLVEALLLTWCWHVRCLHLWWQLV